MVGAVRFELTTSCTRNKRASQATLRPEPGTKVPSPAAKRNSEDRQLTSPEHFSQAIVIWCWIFCEGTSRE